MILLFSIVNVTASLTVEIKTILDDPFIKLLDGRVNNLEDEQVIDIHKDKIDDKYLNPKILSTKTTKELKTLRNASYLK